MCHSPPDTSTPDGSGDYPGRRPVFRHWYRKRHIENVSDDDGRRMTPKSHGKSNFGAHFRLSDGPDKIFWVHSIPCHLKKVCHIMFGGGYASPPLAQTAKVNVDFSEIDHVGSHGSTGDLCLKDTGEGGFGRVCPAGQSSKQ